LGVIDALTRAGLRVPEDVSVTGYDDSPPAQLAAIDLTSVRQDAAELARWAVTAAVERLDGGRTERRESVLTPRLIIRGSSAAPAAG
jgi:DNA-binding LacI/PurR family transcriptional regulator